MSGTTLTHDCSSGTDLKVEMCAPHQEPEMGRVPVIPATS
jgi:hypothetical protein